MSGGEHAAVIRPACMIDPPGVTLSKCFEAAGDFVEPFTTESNFRQRFTQLLVQLDVALHHRQAVDQAIVVVKHAECLVEVQRINFRLATQLHH